MAGDHDPREPHELMGRPAGLVSRAVAAVIDAATVSALFVFGEACVAVARHLLLGRPLALPHPPPLVTAAVTAAITLCYFTWAWATTGRTVGDQIMGLRVRSRPGPLLGLVHAALRALLNMVLPVGLLLVPFSRRRASLQDLIVRSVVVYDWHRERPSFTRRERAGLRRP